MGALSKLKEAAAKKKAGKIDATTETKKSVDVSEVKKQIPEPKKAEIKKENEIANDNKIAPPSSSESSSEPIVAQVKPPVPSNAPKPIDPVLRQQIHDLVMNNDSIPLSIKLLVLLGVTSRYREIQSGKKTLVNVLVEEVEKANAQ